MHRCLEISEILDQICNYLDPNLSYSPSADLWKCTRSADLAALAVTCTTLQVPPLQHLWRSATLGRVLHWCMPRDLFEVQLHSHLAGASYKLILRRAVRPEDWDRVNVYAAYIKELTSGLDDWILSDVFPALSLSIPGTLFANLQKLVWDHSYDDFPWVVMFLHRNLVSLTLRVTSNVAASLLPTLGTRCLNLRNLSISQDSLSDCIYALPGCLRGLQSLEILSVPSLNQDGWEQVSQLRSLKTLNLYCLPATIAFEHSPGRTSLSALAHLAIGSSKIITITHLLKLLTDAPMARLNVRFTDLFTADQIHDLLEALVAGVAHSALTHLILAIAYTAPLPAESDSSAYSISAESLRLLSCFTNLCLVTLEAPGGTDLDDNLLLILAHAWPHLTRLSLTARYSSPARPHVTLKGLQGLAAGCPGLVELRLAIDGTVAPTAPASCPNSDDDQSAIARPRTHPLSVLDVRHSPAPHVDGIAPAAAFLGALFPALSQLSTAREYANNEGDDGEEFSTEEREEIEAHLGWKLVESMLPVVLARNIVTDAPGEINSPTLSSNSDSSWASARAQGLDQ